MYSIRSCALSLLPRSTSASKYAMAVWHSSPVWQYGIAVWYGSMAWQYGMAVWYGSLVWQSGMTVIVRLYGTAVWYGCMVRPYCAAVWNGSMVVWFCSLYVPGMLWQPKADVALFYVMFVNKQIQTHNMNGLCKNVSNRKLQVFPSVLHEIVDNHITMDVEHTTQYIILTTTHNHVL